MPLIRPCDHTNCTANYRGVGPAALTETCVWCLSFSSTTEPRRSTCCRSARTIRFTDFERVGHVPLSGRASHYLGVTRMAEYFVVSRAQSGVRFGKDDPLLISQFPSAIGPVNMIIKTRFVQMPGFSRPLQMGLMAEARGSAPTIIEALQEFSKTVQSICPILVLIGNSPIEDMTPEIGYDVSPDITEREFFQQFLAEENILHIDRRRIPSDLAFKVLKKLFGHTEAKRLQRAIGQYYQALRNWEPGQETLWLSHLWVGAEALTKVVLRRILVEQQLDASELAAAWQIEKTGLDSQIRKREILRGDEESYKIAKSVSDGFEHGFLDYSELHNKSDSVRAKVARHLRKAIIKELAMDSADEALLLNAPYISPGHLHSAKYLRGTLVTPGNQLAAEGQAYPFIEWKTSYHEVPNSSPDEVKFQLREHLTAQIASGATFRIGKIEMWGGQESNMSVSKTTEQSS